VLAAVILSAGESRRMGSPKALLPYHDRTFLEHLLDITKHPRIDCQRVVLGAGSEEIIQRAGLDRAKTVVNPNWHEGQLSSIKCAIRSLAPESPDGILLCLVDQPLITSTLVGNLIAAFYRAGKSVVVPNYRGRRGHPVIFSRALFDELLAASLDEGAREVVRAHPDQVEEVSTDEEGCVLNLNDPATFRRATGGC
jgi:molybdenum cofactor cytidylyltransferase